MLKTDSGCHCAFAEMSLLRLNGACSKRFFSLASPLPASRCSNNNTRTNMRRRDSAWCAPSDGPLLCGIREDSSRQWEGGRVDSRYQEAPRKPDLAPFRRRSGLFFRTRPPALPRCAGGVIEEISRANQLISSCSTRPSRTRMIRWHRSAIESSCVTIRMVMPERWSSSKT